MAKPMDKRYMRGAWPHLNRILNIRINNYERSVSELYYLNAKLSNFFEYPKFDGVEVRAEEWFLHLRSVKYVAFKRKEICHIILTT